MRTRTLLLLLLPLTQSTPLQPLQAPLLPEQTPLLPEQTPLLPSADASPRASALGTMTSALATLQSRFFAHATGTYPTGINWTRAVLGTLLASSIRTLSAARSTRALSHQHLSSLIGAFYGQDMHLRSEAYDDMLWVVLQWLAALQTLAYRADAFAPTGDWAGAEWRAPFAARAREFYALAERGWDDALCGGGMLWSPWAEPYKNAVTNELFVAASVGMYLHHPAHERRWLESALRAHRWLADSGMRNRHGLYTDGFHISRLGMPPEAGEKVCDRRDEMVYTYNQGVLLSGLRGLAEVTGERAYLQEGFELLEAVVTSEGAVGEIVVGGILTEKCDPEGRCSQNGHTFKGIFMHHLTVFCTPLVPPSSSSSSSSSAANLTVAFSAETVSWHRGACSRYHAFIVANAAAAWRTRDADGVVGAWWGAPEAHGVAVEESPFWDAREGRLRAVLDAGATDRMSPPEDVAEAAAGKKGDLNDRGRGRTVESHAGGLAAWRAVVEVVFA